MEKSIPVSISPIFSDGMILQRNATTKVFGNANPGEEITLIFNDINYKAVADTKGEWSVFIKTKDAGGPYIIEVNGSTKLTISDVLVGDLWVCGGQSNMELPIGRVRDLYEDELSNVNCTNIRKFEMPQTYNFNSPQSNICGGKWESVSNDTIMKFSGVGYFFAQKLYQKTGVPIGLIQAAVGGTPVESWMSEEALNSFKKYDNTIAECKNTDYVDSVKKSDEQKVSHWYETMNKTDKGLTENTKWYEADYDDNGWSEFSIPGSWAGSELENVNGSVWFRKAFYVDSVEDFDYRLLFGTIIDADEAYINGTFVGGTAYQYPPRKYTVPGSLIKKGKNVLAIRVISNIGIGGFTKGKAYKLVGANSSIDLAGSWKYKIGVSMEPLQPVTFFQYKPAGLYNGMICPLKDISIKGVIWYQGESNTGEPDGYSKLFTAMVKDWRSNFNNPHLPFLFVQLANFMESSPYSHDSGWAKLREEQRNCLLIPDTAMAVAIDLGEYNDLHPLNKKDLGYRLSLCAFALAYGQNIEYSGPLYDHMKLENGKVILYFSHAGKGLKAADGELSGFYIAGSDGKYIKAECTINGDKVIVWNDKVGEPVNVRYAWADNPSEANLYNSDGLIASPFSTENRL